MGKFPVCGEYIMIIISQKSSSVNINWECPHLYDEWNVLIGSYISPKEIFIRKNIEMYIVYKPYLEIKVLLFLLLFIIIYKHVPLSKQKCICT